MCLVAFSLGHSSRFPFVLASNRDEFYDRPAARLSWWQPDPSAPAILGGRDLSEGGTWLGLTAQGRLGLVTNVRAPSKVKQDAPSRGHLVTRWLRGDQNMVQLWSPIAAAGYNGFNMVALDFAQGEYFWLNNDRSAPERLQTGVFGLSNAELDTPWPKVLNLKARMGDAMSIAQDADDLAKRLFLALSDPNQAPDDALPLTGVSHEWEKLLSSAFIKAPDLRYGTRASTVIITERLSEVTVTHVLERTHTAHSTMALIRRFTVKNWPSSAHPIS